jgi:molybdate transport system substrate-binding protein
MKALVAAGLVDEPVVFARNALVVVVPPDNPAGIERFDQLPKAERLVLAGKSVPVGAYAERALKKAAADYGQDFPARVRAKVVSRETHVRQTLQKVVLGEADAAIVYATDAQAAGDGVTAIPIPAEHNVTASYPIANVRGAPHGRLGAKFIAHVLSDLGQARLREHGMQPPEG